MSKGFCPGEGSVHINAKPLGSWSFRWFRTFLKINEKIKWKKVSGTFFTIGVCDSGEVIFVIFFINQKLMWK